MTAEQRIEALRAQNRVLTTLLAVPQPGLFTWVLALDQCIKQMDGIMRGKVAS